MTFCGSLLDLIDLQDLTISFYDNMIQRLP